mmetsp:Transcript_653/g.937  ORF Transcript_653/g.937 Transcript_653/m.937 type:complete len:263 (-) Transcript_653:204-992(-)|eukprot:CAMPEP_0201476566 /NCGR_PEP_ID=MMETSP0151_2-20130828/1754_1 /ASSEMBLY_ACC=CAM_ASM_000257 /TAXON_ID=200890 /ORGANISM="Paramoeba atlantica, Strain 621/1 / CCAP 1560/9" /LENGTH=262 /DNA_ID=CAMNT_0047856979 /DNA_START=29 /DNA_END=817 /DNA_ORIENTATION=+
MAEKGFLSLAYQELRFIDPEMVQNPITVTKVDASHNSFSDLMGFELLKNLETLVMDGNRISSHSRLPPFPKLHTLSLNKNLIKNLATFVDRLRVSAPQLKYLSMLQNDACPNFFNGGSLKQYRDYRLYVISHFPNLKMLDSSVVTEEEKNTSKELYGENPPPIKENLDDLERKKPKINKRQKRRKKKRVQKEEPQKEKMLDGVKLPSFEELHKADSMSSIPAGSGDDFDSDDSWTDDDDIEIEDTDWDNTDDKSGPIAPSHL